MKGTMGNENMLEKSLEKILEKSLEKSLENEVINMNLENIENKKIMNESEIDTNDTREFRTQVDDFEQIIGMDLEGNVLYTRIEYPMCVEEIMVEMEE